MAHYMDNRLAVGAPPRQTHRSAQASPRLLPSSVRTGPEEMSWSPNVVTVLGSPGAGTTSLVRSLSCLETYDVVIQKDAFNSHESRLKTKFRQTMAAFRSAAEKKRGTVLEGCLAYELCLIDLDLKHGRLG